MVGNTRKVIWEPGGKREEITQRFLHPPPFSLLVLPIVEPKSLVQGNPEVQLAGISLLGQRAGHRRAESGFENSEEETEKG